LPLLLVVIPSERSDEERFSTARFLSGESLFAFGGTGTPACALLQKVSPENALQHSKPHGDWLLRLGYSAGVSPALYSWFRRRRLPPPFAVILSRYARTADG